MIWMVGGSLSHWTVAYWRDMAPQALEKLAVPSVPEFLRLELVVG